MPGKRSVPPYNGVRRCEFPHRRPGGNESGRKTPRTGGFDAMRRGKKVVQTKKIRSVERNAEGGPTNC